jgi:hypothetical protein
MAIPLEGTESAANAIARVKYSHDAMIDLIISNPMASQGEIARYFGYTQAWVSRILNSDAFNARLALRKEEIVDPCLTASVEERLKGLASMSLDVLMRKLEMAPKEETALKALEITTKALGYGARQTNVAVQTSFVVAMPGKIQDQAAWALQHSGQGGGGVLPAIGATFDVPPPPLKLTELIEQGVPG